MSPTRQVGDQPVNHWHRWLTLEVVENIVGPLSDWVLSATPSHPAGEVAVLRSTCCALVLVALFVFIFLLVIPADALLTTFSDRTVFDQVAGPRQLLTFEEFPIGALCLPAHPFIADPCTLTIDGATFVGTIGMPGPVALILTEANGEQTTHTIFAVAGTGTFFGAESDVGFSRLSLYAAPFQDGSTANFIIDNVALAIPEPATLVLVGFGLAGLAGITWRRRRRE